MLFHKKKKEGVPTDEVQRLTATGLSDKDVIKKLKSQGYSYEQIEQAMMQAVKQGVEPQQPMQQNYAQQNYTQPRLQSQNYAQQQQPPYQGGLEQMYSREPEQQPMLELEMPVQQEELDITPEAIVEELVEGVVEEKWQKFQIKVEKLEADIAMMKAAAEKYNSSPSQSMPDVSPRVNEMSEQLDDLQARIGGLERAFKQFLPSLTQNIESLSKMIHEMKQKHGMEMRA